jgi:MFS superfamily sulfate permease-like transporter
MSHIIRKAGDAPIDANRELRAITRVRRDEAMWAFVTVAGVILIGTLPGILIAVAISLLTLMYQANHPTVHEDHRALAARGSRRGAHLRESPQGARGMAACRRAAVIGRSVDSS